MKRLLAVLVIGVALSMLMFFYGWQHSHVVSGLNPFLSRVFAFLFLAIGVAIVIRGLRWVRKRWVGDARYMPAVLFAAGGLSWFIWSLSWGAPTLNVHLSDTYYVISHRAGGGWLMIFFFVVAGIYLLLSKTFASGWLYVLSYVHFWVTFMGCYALFGRMKEMEGLAGMPRRYYDYGDHRNAYQATVLMMNKVWLIVLIMQVVFVCMILYVVIKRFFVR